MSSLRILASIAVLTAATAITPLAAQQESGSMVREEPRIKPGDQVAVRIFREPDLSGSFTVDQAGDIVLPRLGRLNVTGMGPVELQDSLGVAYTEFLRNAAIEISVLRRVAVQGEVRRPDIYMVDLTTTLRELIARAGGITDAGDPRKTVIVRGDEQITVPPGEDARFLAAELRSGDQVFIGRRSWFALNPAVAVSTATGVISFVIGIVLLVR